MYGMSSGRFQTAEFVGIGRGRFFGHVQYVIDRHHSQQPSAAVYDRQHRAVVACGTSATALSWLSVGRDSVTNCVVHQIADLRFPEGRVRNSRMRRSSMSLAWSSTTYNTLSVSLSRPRACERRRAPVATVQSEL